jgi:hypothetical protein
VKRFSNENIVPGVRINAPDEESLRFFTWSWQELLEWAVLTEYRNKGTPIPFRFKDEFYFWKDIEAIVTYFESKSKIVNIKLRTKYSEHEIRTHKEFRSIPELSGEILQKFEIVTESPTVEVEMRSSNVSVHIHSDVPDQMLEDISNMLNKSRRPNAWFSIGGNIWILD